MEVLSDKKTFDINKFNKNVIEEYVNTYSIINNNNNNFEMKNKEEKLLIYVLTFNMSGGMPSDEEMPLLFPTKEKFEKFDIFVINSQECIRSIGASLFYSSKELWVDALSNFFGKKYENIINLTLGAIHMVIFIKKEKSISLSDIRSGEISTGFLNIFANKGAISASMRYYDKHILFICCHLTAGHEKRNERNNDLKRIGTLLQNSIDVKSRNKLRKIRRSVIIENSKIKSNFNSLKNMKTLKVIYRTPNENKISSNTKNESNKKRTRKNSRNSMGEIEPKNILNNEIEEESNDKEDKEDNKSSNSVDEEGEKEEKERLNSTNKNNKEEEINESKNNNNYNGLNKMYNENNKSLSSTLNENDKKDKLINDYDFVIMSGDFNYRLNINHKEISNIMNKNDPEILWDKDQFTEEIKKKHNFKEGIINFMPTYKFKKKSNEYDYTRIPGWTDRILYKSKRYYDIMLCEYSTIKNICISDHKPVYAVFKINFKDNKFISKSYNKNEQECCIY